MKTVPNRSVLIPFVRFDRHTLDALKVVRVTFRDRKALEDARADQDSEFAVRQIEKAVSAWVKETPEGARLWASTNQDLNIGDLSGCLKSPSLKRRLAAVGISRIEVLYTLFSRGGAGQWISYDRVLADDSDDGSGDERTEGSSEA